MLRISTDEELDSVVETLLRYVETNTSTMLYLDVDMNPKYSITGNEVDPVVGFPIISGPYNLTEAIKRIWDTNFDNEFDFHNALIQAFKPLRNSSFMYHPPSCFSIFGYGLPFNFGSTYKNEVVDGTIKGQVIYLQHHSPYYSFLEMTYVKTGSEEYRTFSKLVEMVETKSEILYMEYHNGSIFDGSGSPLVIKGHPVYVISEWGRLFNIRSRDPDASFNASLNSDFAIRSPIYGMPTNESVKVCFDNCDYAVNHLTMNFFAFSSVAVESTTDMETLCKVEGFLSVEGTNKPIGARSTRRYDSGEMIKNTRFDNFQKLVEKNQQQRKDREEQGQEEKGTVSEQLESMTVLYESDNISLLSFTYGTSQSYLVLSFAQFNTSRNFIVDRTTMTMDPDTESVSTASRTAFSGKLKTSNGKGDHNIIKSKGVQEDFLVEVQYVLKLLEEQKGATRLIIDLQNVESGNDYTFASRLYHYLFKKYDRVTTGNFFMTYDQRYDGDPIDKSAYNVLIELLDISYLDDLIMTEFGDHSLHSGTHMLTKHQYRTGLELHLDAQKTAAKKLKGRTGSQTSTQREFTNKIHYTQPTDIRTARFRKVIESLSRDDNNQDTQHTTQLTDNIIGDQYEYILPIIQNITTNNPPDYYSSGGKLRQDVSDLFDFVNPYKAKEIYVLGNGVKCQLNCGMFIHKIMENGVANVVGMGGIYDYGVTLGDIRVVGKFPAYNSPGIVETSSRIVESIVNEYQLTKKSEYVKQMLMDSYLVMPNMVMTNYNDPDECVDLDLGDKCSSLPPVTKDGLTYKYPAMYSLRAAHFKVPYWMSDPAPNVTDSLKGSLVAFAKTVGGDAVGDGVILEDEDCHGKSSERSVYGRYSTKSPDVFLNECRIIYCKEGNVPLYKVQIPSTGLPVTNWIYDCVPSDFNSHIDGSNAQITTYIVVSTIIAVSVIVFFVVRVVLRKQKMKDMCK